MDRMRLNPPELFDSQPVGFSQLVVTNGARRTVNISGQVAWNAKREIVGKDDLYRQVVQSLKNIELALGYADACLDDVVALRIYIKHSHIHDSVSVTRGLNEVFGANQPCATWIGVPALADDDFLVEIEPTVVPSS